MALKILLAEDEEALSRVYKAALEHQGYEVDQAFNGQEAVDLAAQNAYQVMIMDIMMPKLDGFSTCKEIKKIKEIPILLLTGYLGSGKTTLVNHILSNKRGVKFAVIVNDIGEVNIDADLIQKGGIVDKKDDSLVALQNGCICCTLKMDLVEQIDDIMKLGRFDYIVIEASGV